MVCADYVGGYTVSTQTREFYYSLLPAQFLRSALAGFETRT
ncbi:MAG: hypothetical protein RLZZ350_509 [Verrucomicrobiota bacterium]|jgi:hypothetical protein